MDNTAPLSMLSNAQPTQRSLGGALNNYLTPTDAQPGSFRRFAGNLFENMSELVGLDNETLRRNHKLLKAVIARQELISQNAPVPPEIERDAREYDLQMIPTSGAIQLVKDIPKNLYHVSTAKFSPTWRNKLGEFNDTKIGDLKSGGYGQMVDGAGHYFTDDIMPISNMHVPNLVRKHGLSPADELQLYTARFKDRPEISNLKVLQNDQEIKNLLMDDPEIYKMLADRAQKVLPEFFPVHSLRDLAENEIVNQILRADPKVNSRQAMIMAQDIIKRDLMQYGYGATRVPQIMDANNWVVYDPKNIDVINRNPIPLTGF